MERSCEIWIALSSERWVGAILQLSAVVLLKGFCRPREMYSWREVLFLLPNDFIYISVLGLFLLAFPIANLIGGGCGGSRYGIRCQRMLPITRCRGSFFTGLDSLLHNYIDDRRISMGWLRSHKLTALERIMAASIGSWAKKARRRSGMRRRVVCSLIHNPKR